MTRVAALALALFLCAPGAALAQDCRGGALFGTSPCDGDGLDPADQQILDAVNALRAQSGLPAVPWSPSLGIVANRHVRDLEQNVGTLTHGWSNCPYDVANRATYGCMWEAPQRLGTGYPTIGFENAYWKKGGAKATPASAMKRWTESDRHRSVILNQNDGRLDWSNRTWRAVGVAVHGSFAVLWFGESVDPRSGGASAPQPAAQPQPPPQYAPPAQPQYAGQPQYAPPVQPAPQAAPMTRAPSLPPGASYQLVAVNSQKCIDVTPSLADGLPVRQGTCVGAAAPSQLFRLVSLGNGVNQLVVEHSSKCLDLGTAPTAGAPVQQWSCVGPQRPGQLFRLVPLRGDMNQIVSQSTGLCVSVGPPFDQDGAPLVQQTCAVPQATNQLFHIRPLP